MKATDLIGLKMRHASDGDITGQITDVLFHMSLKEAEFILVDVTTPRGTAPVLFSPLVMSLNQGIMITTANADDILARHDASMNRVVVPIDPADLPSTFVGPFGNTFSLSMIAALFNARINGAKPGEADGQQDGVWMSELSDHAVRAHVSDVGYVADILLDDQFARTQNILIKTLTGAFRESPPETLTVTRTCDGQLNVQISQGVAT